MTELLQELAAALEGVTSVTTGEAVEYRRGRQLFAAQIADGAVELRLPPDLAEAATRTPSTTGSSRGPDWIRFHPTDWDDHARDRLDAWFRVAWRAAAR